MADRWYPVIDCTLCTECGTCTDKCRHGVYDQGKAPAPVVVDSKACIDHCRGCSVLCPAGAISYAGDDGKENKGSPSCGCSA